MIVVPTDGMVIRQSMTLAPGVYDLPQGLTIASDGVTVDGAGVLLVGQDHTGVGLHIDGQHDVTIKRDRALWLLSRHPRRSLPEHHRGKCAYPRHRRN